MAIRIIEKLKKKVCKRLGLDKRVSDNKTDAVRFFKTEAWQSSRSSQRYHQATKDSPAIFQLVRQDLYIDLVRRYVPEGGRILDLGCGSGLVSLALAGFGYDVVSCDVSRSMLDVLESEKGDLKLETRCGDAHAIPAEDGEFDAVISRMFIQHFVEWPKILVEKARVVKPGGHVIFDFGNREHFEATGLSAGNDCGFPYENDPAKPTTFYALADEAGMRAAASAAGLQTVEISPAGLLLYNGFFWRKYGTEGVAEFNRTLDALLERDGARDLMVLIEKTILPLLPKTTTYCNMTVLRK